MEAKSYSRSHRFNFDNITAKECAQEVTALCICSIRLNNDYYYFLTGIHITKEWKGGIAKKEKNKNEMPKGKPIRKSPYIRERF